MNWVNHGWNHSSDLVEGRDRSSRVAASLGWIRETSLAASTVRSVLERLCAATRNRIPSTMMKMSSCHGANVSGSGRTNGFIAAWSVNRNCRRLPWVDVAMTPANRSASSSSATLRLPNMVLAARSAVFQRVVSSASMAVTISARAPTPMIPRSRNRIVAAELKASMCERPDGVIRYATVASDQLCEEFALTVAA